MKMEQYLYDLAAVFRSKNAGPFRTTIDMFFKNRSTYEKVKSSNVITKQTVAGLFKIPVDHVEGIYHQDQAMGIKVTVLKPITADNVFATDVYGAQQHAPLLKLKINLTEGKS
jgi:hypothetical protein